MWGFVLALSVLPLVLGVSLPSSRLQYRTHEQGLHKDIHTPLGQPVHTDKTPDPCCMQGQVEGVLSFIEAYPYLQETVVNTYTTTFSYDAANQSLNLNYTGKERNYRIIILLKEKRRYWIEPNGACLVEDYDEFDYFCVPGDYKHVGRFRRGLGPDSMAVDVWRAKDDFGAQLEYISTPYQCAYQGKKNYLNGAWFKFEEAVSLTSGIKDPDVFKHPSDCYPVKNQEKWSEKPFNIF